MMLWINGTFGAGKSYGRKLWMSPFA
jgi:hypothetical protein